jgi:hypothetical protein
MSEPAADTQRHERTEKWKHVLFRWLVFVQLLALFGIAYVKIGGMLIEQTNNTDKQILGSDQKHNMRWALETRQDLHPDFRKGISQPLKDFFPHRTDGVIQPLWPWIAAWFADPQQKISDTDEVQQDPQDGYKDRDFFNQGRWFHVYMTLFFLSVLGIAALRVFTFPAACNLVLLGGLGALLPRSAFFQPEPLYYVFFFLTWVACISALSHNTLWIYGLIGVLGGVAYMAKASVSPMLGVFVGVSSLRCIWEIVSARRRGFHLATGNLWHWRNHLMGLIVLGIAHFITIGPRLADASEKYGSMFHSYPAYWMWMDSFGGPPTVNDPNTCYGWMDKHQTREQLENILPSERPSLGNYLRTHSREDVISRLWDGVKSKVGEFFWPKQNARPGKKVEKFKGWRNVLDWRGIYLSALALFLVGLLVVLATGAPRAQHAGHLVFKHGTTVIVLFVLGTFAAYALLYGWYSPIAKGSGDRFMLSLYLPLVFSLIWGAESIVRRIRRRHGSPWIGRSYRIAQWLLFAALVWHVVEIFQVPKFFNSSSS